MKKIGAVLNRLEKVQVTIGILALATIGIIIPLQVFCRYVLNSPLPWVEEVATGLSVWMAFLGAAVLYKRKRLVAVEFFIPYFPKAFKPVFSVVIDSMIFVLSIMIIILGYRLSLVQMMSTQVGSGIPRAYFFTIPLIVNFSTVLIYSLYAITQSFVSEVDVGESERFLQKPDV